MKLKTKMKAIIISLLAITTCMLTMVITLTCIPAVNVSAATNYTSYKEEYYTVKNCSGKVYIPTQLANLVQSQVKDIGAWPELNASNEAYVINTKTKITWDSSDYVNVALFGVRISEKSAGKYTVDIMEGIGYKDQRYKSMRDYTKDWGKDFIKLGAYKNFTLHYNDKYNTNWVDGYGNVYWERDIEFPTENNGTDFVYDIYALRLWPSSTADGKVLLLVPENLTKIAYESEETEYCYQDVKVNCLTKGYSGKHIDKNEINKKNISFDSKVTAHGKITYTVGTARVLTGKGCELEYFSAKKYISIDKKGKVTVKKGTPAGVYQIRVNAQKEGKFAKTYAWFSIDVS